jgi:hypothetical protein
MNNPLRKDEKKLLYICLLVPYLISFVANEPFKKDDLR